MKSRTLNMTEGNPTKLLLIFACLLNIGPDIWFVYGMELEIMGVAISTVLSRFAAGVGCLIFAAATNPYFKLRKRHFRVDWKMVWQTLRMGVPLSLQYFAWKKRKYPKIQTV